MPGVRLYTGTAEECRNQAAKKYREAHPPVKKSTLPEKRCPCNMGHGKFKTIRAEWKRHRQTGAHQMFVENDCYGDAEARALIVEYEDTYGGDVPVRKKRKTDAGNPNEPAGLPALVHDSDDDGQGKPFTFRLNNVS